MPSVSIVIPTHNRAAFLAEALESVLAQTYRDWECIVVDDGSTDRTPELLGSMSAAETRLRSLRIEQGGRAGRTRNHGVRAATGEWLAFLDDDDAWLPQKLELQLAVIARHPRAVMTFGRVERFGAESGPWPSPPAAGPLTLRDLLRANVVPCSTVLARRDAVLAAGGFHEATRIAEDYELWLRLCHRGEVIGVAEVLSRYRVHAGGLTKRETSELDDLEALYNRIERDLALPPSFTRPGRRRVALRRLRAARTWAAKLASLRQAAWPRPARAPDKETIS